MFFCVLQKNLCKIKIISFLNFWKNSPGKKSEPQIVFVGSCLVTDSIYLIDTEQLRFPVSSFISFSEFFKEYTDFMYVTKFKLKTFLNILLISFYCLKICSHFPFFSPDIGNLCFSHVFFSYPEYISFINIFREPAFGFVNFLCCIFLNLLIPLPVFISFLPLFLKFIFFF